MLWTAFAVCVLTGCGAMQSGSDEGLVNYECTDESSTARTVRPFPTKPGERAPELPASEINATMLERNRITGKRSILPNDRTKDRMGKMGIDMLSATFKVCVSADGVPTLVERQYSSCFPPYDEDIRDAILAWRYKPSAAACSTVQFVYETRNHR